MSAFDHIGTGSLATLNSARIGAFSQLHNWDLEPESSIEDIQALYPELMRPNRKPDPTTMLFTGRRGEGKTNAITWLLRRQSQRYKNFRSISRPLKMLTNYSVSFVEEQQFHGWPVGIAGYLERQNKDASQLFLPMPCVDPDLAQTIAMDFPYYLQGSKCSIDEMQTVFYSLDFNSRRVKGLSQVLVQIRKRLMDLMFSTQNPIMIAKHALFQIDIIAICEKHWKPGGGLMIKMYLVDLWGKYRPFRGMRPFPPYKGEHDAEFTITDAESVWGMFDTDEIIVPPSMENGDNLRNQFYSKDFSVDDKATIDDIEKYLRDLRETIRRDTSSYEHDCLSPKAFNEGMRRYGMYERNLQRRYSELMILNPPKPEGPAIDEKTQMMDSFIESLKVKGSFDVIRILERQGTAVGLSDELQFIKVLQERGFYVAYEGEVGKRSRAVAYAPGVPHR